MQEIGKGPSKAFHDNGYMSRKEIEVFRNKAEEEWK